MKELKRSNPYATDVHSHILQGVVQDLKKAFQPFFRRVKAGETPDYPRFKGRNRFDSFGLKEYGNGFKLDSRRLRLSGMGRVRFALRLRNGENSGPISISTFIERAKEEIAEKSKLTR